MTIDNKMKPSYFDKNPAKEYFDRGIRCLSSAISLDNARNYAQALLHYRQAIGMFNLAQQQPQKFVEPISVALNDYLLKCKQRVETLSSSNVLRASGIQQAPTDLSASYSGPINPNTTPNTFNPKASFTNPTTPNTTPNALNPNTTPNTFDSNNNNIPSNPPPNIPNNTTNNNASNPVNTAADKESNEFKDKISSAILIEKPNIKFDDVAGLSSAKQALEEAVILPLRLPQFFTGERSPWHGILLYGPPGTGKSFLAKATATESDNSTFLTVSTSDLVSKYLGDSEKLIRALFNTARERKPSIIFIDEIDSLLSERTDNDSEASRRIKTEFLVQLDGVGKSMEGILLLAATNTPWSLDPAVRRRFEKKIYIPLPDIASREYLLINRMTETPHSLTQNDFHELGQLTEGFSGADIKILTREASFVSLRNLQSAQYFCEYQGMMWPCNPDQPGAVRMGWREVDPMLLHPPLVTMDDFKQALMKVRPSVSPDDLERYERWTEEFGQEGN